MTAKQTPWMHPWLLSIKILFGKTFVSFKLNSLFRYTIYTPRFNITPFKSLIYFKDFLRFLNGETEHT